MPLGATGSQMSVTVAWRGQRSFCPMVRLTPVSTWVVVDAVLLVSSLSAIALKGST